MSKKATAAVAATKSSSKAAKATVVSASRNSASKKSASGAFASEKFVAAKSGRVIKSSAVEPRLGRERIQSAVKNYVNRDAEAEKSYE